MGTIYMECGWKTPGVEECMEPVGEARVPECYSLFLDLAVRALGDTYHLWV